MTDAPRRSVDQVRVGERLPAVQVRISLMSLVRYAAATWDFHRSHYDAAYAAEAGLRAPVLDGQMIGALLAKTLMAWGGPDAFLRSLSYRQSEPVHADDSITLSGEVVGVEPGPGGRASVTWALSIAGADGTAIVSDARAKMEV